MGLLPRIVKIFTFGVGFHREAAECGQNAHVKILLVEDDRSIASSVVEGLEAQGFQVTHVANGAGALAAAEHDMVLLDLGLPDMDGRDVCRELRGRTKAPIIMLTARSEEFDRVLGLELGADDYLPKPCNPRELLARIRAVLRRRQEPRGGEGALGAGVEFAGWRLDLVRRELRTPQGVVVNLSSGEFSLLRAFVERPQRVLTRDQLLDFARGPDTEAYDRAIDVQISRLRKKLEDGAGGQELIRTIRNEGYMFTAKVTRT